MSIDCAIALYQKIGVLDQFYRGTLFYSILPGSVPQKLDSLTTLFKRLDRDLT